MTSDSTKRNPNSPPAPVLADAGTSEITPAMIAAGIEAYLACDREFEPYEKIITDVFRSMVEARREQTPAVSSDPQLRSVSHWWLI